MSTSSTTIITGRTSRADVAGAIASITVPTDVIIRPAMANDVNAELSSVDVLATLRRARDNAALDVAQAASAWRKLRAERHPRAAVIRTARAELDAATGRYDAAAADFVALYNALQRPEAPLFGGAE